MLKDSIKKYVKGKAERISAAPIVLLIIALISLALTYGATRQDGPTKTGNFSSLDRDGTEGRQAILQWMKENSNMPEQVLAKIYSAAKDSFNTDLVLAICVVESNFNPHIESDKGAIGLMGIMPSVWLKELEARGIVSGKEDLYIISKNIDSGAYVLETYMAKTNDLREALSRYSGGDASYANRVLRVLAKISLTRHAEQELSLARAQ
jgi:soluble lytic murein transglycosylase-like protein